MAIINSMPPSSTESTNHQSNLRAWQVVLLAVLAIAAFWPTLRNGYIWDDNDYVTNNYNLRTGSGLIAIWTQPDKSPQYYPAAFTTFWLEYHLWNLDPVGYHTVNVLLHLGSAMLLWRLLARLKIPAAFPAACLFAVHPIYVESVAWISELKNTQSTFFYLLAFHAYLGSGLIKLDADQKIRWRWFTISFGLFVLALLSKTVTSSFPAAMLLVVWWKQGKITWRDLRPLIAFFVTGIAMGFFTAYLEKLNVGATGDEFKLDLAQRCVICGRAIWFYACKITWPARLTFIYPRWLIDPSQRYWLLLFPASAAVSVIALIVLRRRIGRGPVAAVLFFLGTLFPALGFVNVFPFTYSFVADHFQYLAGIGLIVLIAAGLQSIGSRLGQLPGKIAFAALLVSLIALANYRCFAYRDSETLWRDTIAKNPTSWMAELNLANALMSANRIDGPDGARTHYSRSRDLAPNQPEPVWNLGVVEAKNGRYPEAITLYRKAITILPTFAEAYNDIGNALAATGDLPGAIDNYRIAVRLKPRYADAHCNLGVALEKQKDLPGAMAEYRAAIADNPLHAQAHFNLANCFLAQGDGAQALSQYSLASQSAPAWADPYAYLGYIYMRDGDFPSAEIEFRLALQRNPHQEMARRGLLALRPELR